MYIFKRFLNIFSLSWRYFDDILQTKHLQNIFNIFSLKQIEDALKMCCRWDLQNIFNAFPYIWIIFPRSKVLKMHFFICFKEVFLKMSYSRPFQIIRGMSWKHHVFTGTFYICLKELFLKMSYSRPFQDIPRMTWKCLVFTGRFWIWFKEILLKMS